MDFIQTLDPSKLVLAGTAVSLLLSISNSPPYNLAIFLFGCYAQEATEAVQSLQIFTGLLGTSAVLDIIWMFSNNQHGLSKFITVCLLLLKLPTILAFVLALRQRGSQFGGLGAANLGGPTVWSMPGGFTSGGREGYQTVDDDAFVRNIRTGPTVPQKPAAPADTPAAPGAYQTV